YEFGKIFQHFGHTEFFKIYDISDGKITGSELISSNGSGHGALAGLLKEHDVNALICGGIGGGAKAALAEAGIAVYGGVTGDADEAVSAFAAGKLSYDPDVMCSHHNHGEEHSCGNHVNDGGHSCHHGNCG
ncbi:MAG: dinitrogenase iron-molybdenum cofactor biosynthesis protein, partial [Oscillospiraceae bacterium]|nr:dinitrogenase iron-molybdenum cofactor biosynthesis protein [Oscillospiraceae bacterium]